MPPIPPPQTPPVQAAPTPQPTNITQIQKSNKRKLVWGIICLVGPTALLIISILLYALFNAMNTPSAAPSESESLFGETTPMQTITNVVLYLVGIVSVTTWLPGVIVGIILLAGRKRM